MIEAIKSIPNWETLTATEIADAIKTIKATRLPIKLGDLLFLLNNRGMLVRLIRPAGTGEKWSGTVVNMIMHVNENVPALAGPVNQWFSHITNDRNSLFDTSRPEYGAQLALLASSFGGQPTMPTVEDFDAIAGLGGGWLYADLTPEIVTDAIDAYRLQERKLAVETLYRDAINQHVAHVVDGDDPTSIALAAAFRAAADSIDGGD